MDQQNINRVEPLQGQSINNDKQQQIHESQQELIQSNVLLVQDFKEGQKVDIIQQVEAERVQNSGGINEEKILNGVLKESHTGKNVSDISLICIELLSQLQTFERKETIFDSMKWRFEQKPSTPEIVYAELGVQTSNDLVLQQRKEVQIKRVFNLRQQVSFSQQQQYGQLRGRIQPQRQQQDIPVFSQSKGQNLVVDQIKVVDDQDGDIKAGGYELRLFQIQNLKGGQQQSDWQMEMPQTAYFQQGNSQPSLRKESIEDKELMLGHKDTIEEILEEEKFILTYLGGIQEDQYDQVIQQLTQRVAYLQFQYLQLLQSKVQKTHQITNAPPSIQPLQKQAKQQQQLILSAQTESKTLQMNKLYDYAIIPQNPPQKEQKQDPNSQHNKIQTQKQTQRQQQSLQQDLKQQSNLNQQSQSKKEIPPPQFSSGDVENLLLQDTNSLAEISNLNIYQSKPTILQLSEQPFVFSSNLYQQNPVYQSNQVQSTQTNISILSISQFNLATIKQSYEQLPYNKMKSIMNLELLISKISFKEKHYPSSLSNDKELKLYGKRLVRTLWEISAQNQPKLNQNKISNLQNQSSYEVNEQSVVYFLKNHKNLVIICYFNHTVYIGEYIIQGPKQQITRQGYGIQIRESKYLYQGDFFADKKHGYGYVQFTGKNPYIYCGYFLDGFMDGQGKSMKQNGQVYIGDHKLGQRDGFGKLTYNNEKTFYYEGQFYDGRKHGKGCETFQNGDIYSGSYFNDKFQGEGEYKWKNGTIYRGIFLEGYKHGQGELILNNGKTFQKYYDHNKQINIETQEDRFTIKSSRLSTVTQSKVQQKYSTHDKARSLKNYRSLSGRSLFSNISQPKEKSLKNLKSKRNIAELLKQKQLQEDLRNLDAILREPENKRKKIFSVKKLDDADKLVGKMYNKIERPTIKLSGGHDLDLFKLGKFGVQKKSLISFNKEDQLQQLRQSQHSKRTYPVTNFSQF